MTIFGCSTVAKLNIRGQVGLEDSLKSTYKTRAVEDNFDLAIAPSYALGLGYYGLIENLNIYFEGARADFQSRNLDDRVNTFSTHLFGEYYFTAKDPSFPFVGLGLGVRATSVGDESAVDKGNSILLKAGWMWRMSKQGHIYVQFNYDRVSTAHVNRFYYFGGSADVQHEIIGVSVGIVANLLHEPAAASASGEH